MLAAQVRQGRRKDTGPHATVKPVRMMPTGSAPRSTTQPGTQDPGQFTDSATRIRMKNALVFSRRCLLLLSSHTMWKSIFDDHYALVRRRKGLLHLGLLLRSRLARKYLHEGTAILDVGAAEGAMIALLSERMHFSLAVSLERSQALAARIARNGVRGDGLALPFANSVFDFVVCSATRKHIKDSLTLAKEMARVLKPGGRVIVIDPHPFLLRLGRWVGKFDPRYLHHFSSAADISEEFRLAGLEPRHQRTGIFVCCVGEKTAN